MKLKIFQKGRGVVVHDNRMWIWMSPLTGEEYATSWVHLQSTEEERLEIAREVEASGGDELIRHKHLNIFTAEQIRHYWGDWER